MGEKVIDGGPAYPQAKRSYATQYGGGSTDVVSEIAGGMSMRDAFALAALPAILAQSEDGIQAWAPTAAGGNSTTAAESWAKNAYEIADAMLAERAK